MIKTLLYILIPFLVFAQNDWSGSTVNYPDSLDNTASLWDADSADFVPGSSYNKNMRIMRLLQEKVGVGVDTPKTAREVLIVVQEDSTEWRTLVDADIPDNITVTGVVSDSSFFRAETDTLAGKTGNSIVLEDTLTGISYMELDSLNLGGENLIKIIKVGTHLAVVLAGSDTMWCASDTTGF